MKNNLLLLFSAFALSIAPQVFAGDNDDAPVAKVQTADTETAERDPFQLPDSVKRKGLEDDLNKLSPAAGPAEGDNSDY